MTTELEVATLINAVALRAAATNGAPLGRGFVASVSDGKASIRISRDDAPIYGFDVPAWLDLQVDDYVLFRESGADRVILAPLDRNAAAEWNPLTTAGQIIVAGDDGSPSVIEPPDDPTLDYVLEWDGTTNRPVWVVV